MKEVIDLTVSSPRSNRSASQDNEPGELPEPASRTRQLSSVNPRSESNFATPITISDDEGSSYPKDEKGSNSSPKKKKRRRSKKAKDAVTRNDTPVACGKDASDDKVDATDLFFFDEKAETNTDLVTGEEHGLKTSRSLALPEHVTVDDDIKPPNLVLPDTVLSDSDADDFINYADAEIAVSMLFDFIIARLTLRARLSGDIMKRTRTQGWQSCTSCADTAVLKGIIKRWIALY